MLDRFSALKKMLNSIRCGNQREVLETIKKENIDIRSSFWLPVFHAAAENGSLEVVRNFIMVGVDVNAKNSYTETALHLACRKCRPEIVRALIEAKANVNVVNDDGVPSLYFAAKMGNLEIVMDLINAGANVNAKTNLIGETVLHAAFASLALNTEIIRLLVKAGADVNVKNDNGWSPLHMVCSRCNDLPHTLVEVAQILIDAGANIDSQNNLGYTPAHLAAYNGNDDVLVYLINRDANLFIKNNDNKTVLDFVKAQESYDKIMSAIQNRIAIDRLNSESSNKQAVLDDSHVIVRKVRSI